MARKAYALHVAHVFGHGAQTLQTFSALGCKVLIINDKKVSNGPRGHREARAWRAGDGTSRALRPARFVRAALGLWVLLLLLSGCASPVAIDDLDRAPRPTSADEQLADVYRALDGTWRGEFRMYVEPDGQPHGERPTEFSAQLFARLDLTGTIDVQQTYTSESPYFQRVEIVDSYPDGHTVRSRGVNKVQDGKMWCVVRKPDDLVVHHGSTGGPHTIIWQRERVEPKAIEYFRETVEADAYQISGWGYYGADDPALAPRMYFDATYRRIVQ